MITATSLQSEYNKLYVEFRNYIWNFDIIEALADLETEVFQTFPDIEAVKSKFRHLKQQVSYTDVLETDEDLAGVFNDFEESIEAIDGLYANLKSFKKVVVK